MSRACRRDQSSTSMSAASCDADSRMTPSLIGGQRNAPSSRRFQYKIRPEPSQAKIFNRSARFERKTRIVRIQIALKLVLRQRRQAVSATPEVDRLRRHKNPNARGNRNHVAAFTARSTFVSVATSVPGLTRTTAAPSAISIVPHGIAQEAAEDGAAPSTITGAKVTPPAAAP